MKIKLKVKGMHCPSCEILVNEALEDLGVKSESSHKAGTVEAEFDETKVSPEQIKRAIKDEGYEVI